MDNKQTAMEMLKLMVYPGFCVKDGIVVQTNQAAASLLINCGTKIASALHTGVQEYADFTGGCLYLTLQFNETVFSASVHRIEDLDIFLLEPQQEELQLQAYALAAQALREPLTTLMTLPGLLDAGIDPKHQEQAAMINRSLFQMLRLVSNMSDAHRYRTNPTPRMEMRCITSVAEELFEKIAASAGQAGVSVHFSNLPADLYCLIDAEKLERGVYNMISNSLKFTKSGGHIEAALTRRSNRLYLTVQDSGSGIAQDLRGTLHSRFLRQPGLEEGRHGIGLGMLLICMAATAHGGTVLTENIPDSGTRTTITMEIRQNNQDAVRSPRLCVDYAGEWDHSLMELSDVLPAAIYSKKK